MSVSWISVRSPRQVKGAAVVFYRAMRQGSAARVYTGYHAREAEAT